MVSNSSSSSKASVKTPSKQSAKPSFFQLIGRAVQSIYARVPMITKLVTCTIIILIIGMFGISLSIRQLVNNYLLSKTDLQLIQQADLVYNNTELLRTRDSADSAGPNDYFLQVRDANNKIISTPLMLVLQSNVVSTPHLPADGESSDEIIIGQPFTTTADVTLGSETPDRSTLTQANAPWRVLALQWIEKTPTGTSVGGVVYIGLSLSDSIDIINTLTRYSIIVSVIVITLGALVAIILIHNTLMPLKRIEKTAACIAGGDLSERVPSAPENTEVGSLSASINAMLATIEHSFKQQEKSTEKMKRFVSDASHELRTPLAAIHGYSELYMMQRDMPGALQRADESIRHIEASSSRMTLLVTDLLSLARLDEGRGIDMTQQLNITHLVNDAADDLHALDPERAISLQTLAVGMRSDEEGLTEADGSSGDDGVSATNAAVVGAGTGADSNDHDANALGIIGHTVIADVSQKQGSTTYLPDITIIGDASRLRQVLTNIIGNIHRYTPADTSVQLGIGIVEAQISPSELAQFESEADSLEDFFDTVIDGSVMDYESGGDAYHEAYGPHVDAGAHAGTIDATQLAVNNSVHNAQPMSSSTSSYNGVQQRTNNNTDAIVQHAGAALDAGTASSKGAVKYGEDRSSMNQSRAAAASQTPRIDGRAVDTGSTLGIELTGENRSNADVATRYVIIRVVDHGPGVAPDEQSKIFERFYTADLSRAREKGGTGLGMAIVQSIVKAHRGLICPSTSAGGGLTLTIVLPL